MQTREERRKYDREYYLRYKKPVLQTKPKKGRTYPTKPSKDRACDICGKLFTPSSHNDKRCGNRFDKTSCKHKGLLLQCRKWSKSYKPPVRFEGTTQLRYTILERDKRTCQKCGLKNSHIKFFDVDHKDANRDNNDPTNLWTLCPNCHRIKSIENGDWDKARLGTRKATSM